jgi:hypothetical protein
MGALSKSAGAFVRPPVCVRTPVCGPWLSGLMHWNGQPKAPNACGLTSRLSDRQPQFQTARASGKAARALSLVNYRLLKETASEPSLGATPYFAAHGNCGCPQPLSSYKNGDRPFRAKGNSKLSNLDTVQRFDCYPAAYPPERSNQIFKQPVLSQRPTAIKARTASTGRDAEMGQTCGRRKRRPAFRCP